MDTAIVIFRDGRCEEMSAAQYREYRYSGVDSRLCPACKKPVDFRDGGVRKAHFKHKNGVVGDDECENYIRSESYSRRRTHEIPFYIEKRGDTFQLYIGFSKLSEKRIDEIKTQYPQGTFALAIRHTSEEIENIRVSTLKPDEPKFIPLRYIRDTYRIWSPLPEWEYEPSGFPSINDSHIKIKGAFFHISKGKSSKVSCDGNVVVGMEYYLMIPKNSYNYLPTFLETDGKWCEIYNESDTPWIICRVAFTEFSARAQKFAKRCNVTLAEKLQEYIPLWSPMIQHDSVESGEQQTTHILTEPGKVFYFADFPIDAASAEIGKSFSPLPLLTGRENYVDTTFTVGTEYHYPTYKPPKLTILWNGEEIEWSSETVIPLKTKTHTLSITSSIPCDISHLHGSIVIDAWVKKQRIQIDNLKNDDRILVLHGHDCIASFSFQRKTKEVVHNKREISDEKCYAFLTMYDDMLVPFSVQLKYIIPKFVNYPKTFECLKMMMKKGTIGKKAEDYIIQLYKNGGI